MKIYRVKVIGRLYCSDCGIKFEMGHLDWVNAHKIVNGTFWFIPMGGSHGAVCPVADTERVVEVPRVK